MTHDNREVLNEGFGAVSESEDEERLATEIRIVPIGEGDITEGDSGTPTFWDRETLRRAVEAGAFDGAEIIKGRGGTDPHFPLDEHVPPENKLGRVESWEYEDGVGPVGFTEIVSDEIAERVELGLLDVSADMFRVLGEEDPEIGAHRVEEILAVPRITLLDRGASASASIEPIQVEALGLNPDQFDYDDEPMTEQNMLHEMWQKLSDYFGQEASDSNQVYNTVDNVSNHEDKSDVGDEVDANEPQNTLNMSEDEIQELRQKLRDRESEMSDTKEEVESLNEKIEDLESDISGKEEQLEEYSQAVEDKESEIEELQGFVEPMEEMMAEIVAADSELLTAETVAEKYTLPELVDLLAASDDDSDDKSYTEKVKEQLAQNVQPRGDGQVDDTPTVTPEEMDDMAYEALTARDLQAAERTGLAPAEYLQEAYGVNVAEAQSGTHLRQKVGAARRGE